MVYYRGLNIKNRVGGGIIYYTCNKAIISAPILRGRSDHGTE